VYVGNEKIYSEDTIIFYSVDTQEYCRRFDPGGSLDRRVNCRACPSPDGSARDGARRGEGNRQRGNPWPSCCLAPRSGALAVGGYKRPRGRERETYASARSPARPTFL
jgi:hypothetical protein